MRKFHRKDGNAEIPLGYKSGSNHYYVTDHLGSVVGMFSQTGTYEGGYSYSPYGETRATSTNAAVTANPLRYIAGYQEAANLYKLGARYNDTTTGRFMQIDPSGQELNPYAYASLNPTNLVDPSGLAGYCSASVGCTGLDAKGNPIYASGPTATTAQKTGANGCFLSAAATALLPAPPVTVVAGVGITLYCISTL